jgi:hypothetical protein
VHIEFLDAHNVPKDKSSSIYQKRRVRGEKNTTNRDINNKSNKNNYAG